MHPIIEQYNKFYDDLREALLIPDDDYFPSGQLDMQPDTLWRIKDGCLEWGGDCPEYVDTYSSERIHSVHRGPELVGVSFDDGCGGDDFIVFEVRCEVKS